MATQLPPPTKKQRREAAEKSRTQQDAADIPTDLGSVRVQFVDRTTGQATGGAVAIPVVDATVKNLETLVNSLLSHVSTCTCVGGARCRPNVAC